MSDKQVRYISARKPKLDHYIQAAIDDVEGVHNDAGHYGTLRITGIESKELAAEYVRVLHLARRRMGHGMFAKIHNASDGTFIVEFTVVDKAHANAYIAAKKANGGQLAYSPGRRN